MTASGPQQNLKNWVRFLALYISFFIVIGLVLLFNGKEDLHIYINQSIPTALDSFFVYTTHLGDGLMFIPVALIVMIFSNLRNVLRVLLAGLLCLVLAGLLKHYVFPDAMRPLGHFGENHSLRLIEGVKVHLIHSFPSGHALTAFCLATLLTGIAQRWAALWFFLAFLAAFSRVILSQHFLVDIWAGSLVGVLIGLGSFFFFSKYNAQWLNYRILKTSPKTRI